SGPAVLDHDGGAIRTSAAIEALTGALGDSVVTDEVIAIRSAGRGRVEVQAGGSRHHYERVLVCAGQGTAHLARDVGLSLPIRAAAHVRCTFAVRNEPPVRLACLQDGSGDFGETGTYATPEPGNRRYSVGLSQTVEVQGDGSLSDPAGLADLADRASAYVREALPGLDSEPLGYRHCWVTELPWGPDGVAVWEADATSFVAGHNLFKQAPALGRALAGAALGDGLPDELRPDAHLGRPA
ncbi:MAG: FAD-dependent oxidoreductase, partial [Actinomycetota bacterium]|nr:FAD-dependent oxidoreductase [Actinomycetota bacterium]